MANMIPATDPCYHVISWTDDEGTDIQRVYELTGKARRDFLKYLQLDNMTGMDVVARMYGKMISETKRNEPEEVNAEKRKITSARWEYVLKTPVIMPEFDKAYDWARRDAASATGVAVIDLPANVLKVGSTDEEVIIYWIEENITNLKE